MDEWAIGAHSSGGLPVRACCGARLLVCRAMEPLGWSELADDMGRATRLHMLSFPHDRLWAGWVDHRVGPCYLPL